MLKGFKLFLVIFYKKLIKITKKYQKDKIKLEFQIIIKLYTGWEFINKFPKTAEKF